MKTLTSTVTFVLMLSLTGCASMSSRDVGTTAGAVGGGALGYAMGGGVLGTLLGAGGGAFVGNQVTN